jgi:potassium-dependent mechanosensitive channel
MRFDILSSFFQKPCARLRSGFFVVLTALCIATHVSAQTQDAPTENPPIVAPLPTADAPKAVVVAPAPRVESFYRATLDPLKGDLERMEKALGRANVSDGEMERFRERLKPLEDELRTFLNEAQGRVDAAKARQEQLGPKPDDKSPHESAELAREREERDRVLKDALEGQKLGNALLVQADQLSNQLTERKRTAFRKVLFEAHSPFVMPELWLGVISNYAQDMRAIRLIQSDWLSSVFERFQDRRGILLVACLLLALGMVYVRRFLQTKVVLRDPAQLNPSRQRIALAALAHIGLGTIPIALACYFVFLGLNVAGLTPPRVTPFLIASLGTVVFVAFVKTLIEALISPDIPHWRYLQVQDRTADLIKHLAVSLALLVSFNKIGEALLQATAASVPLSVAWRGSFAIVFALTVMGALKGLNTAASIEDDDCLGPYVPAHMPLSGPLRLVGWGTSITIFICALAGYVVLAQFIMDQLIWVALVGALLFFSLNLCHDLIGYTLAGETLTALALQTNLGIRKRSLEQISVLLTGFVRVLLIILAALVTLLPWGFEAGDLSSTVKSAFFGFKVGDVTISLSSVLMAIVFFMLGLAATRAVQRWLEGTYLPSTDLDSGLRNSIKTAFGYVGVLIAAMLAFSQLGISLDKLTIVAGALSVGIGFGLQSIVSNFVSGLILLWERPIRVDDLVVTGDVEGYVKRINVRSTEFETFDRATVIVPNSNLISGVVKNRMRNSRMGRIVIPLSVARTLSPDTVRTMLLEVASQNTDILTEPAPRVLFKKIGDAQLEFELIAFVGNVDTSARVSSEMHFAIFAQLQEWEKEAPVAPPAHINVMGLDRLEHTLEHIADAIEHDQDEMSVDEKIALRRRLREDKKREVEEKEHKR